MSRKSAQWASLFEKLRQFKKQFGHVQVPRDYPDKLALWLAAQKTGLPRLSLDQIQRLWDLGVRFPGKENQWLFQFFKLVKAREKFGDVNDHRIWKKDRPLKSWIGNQRGPRRKKMPAYRRRLLNELGLAWNIKEANWERRFKELLAFKARFGHALVPNHWPENPRLGEWLASQRHIVKDPRRRKRLAELGCFDRREDMIWNRRFAEWQAYVRKTGTTSFPVGKTHLTLAHWSRLQRIYRKEGTLEDEKIRRLTKAGFPWDPRADQWEKSFRKFAAFWKKHRRIPLQGENQALAVWCWDKIRDYKLGELAPERVARFDALGFVWNLKENFWEQMFGKLRQFQARHGHCRVSRARSHDIRLVQWVIRQRQERKRGKIPAERIKRLDALGFDWDGALDPDNKNDPRNARWEEMRQRLIRFHRRYGHYGVPQIWKPDPQLGKWVGSQRRERKNGRLPPERARKLEEIGFDWGYDRPRRKSRSNSKI